MQQVTHAETQAIIALANANTKKNRKYKINGPGLAEIKETTALKASPARQRRRYISGTIKCETSAQPKAKRTIKHTQKPKPIVNPKLACE